MSHFKKDDRVVVMRVDSDDVECHGCYVGQEASTVFVVPDNDDLPDPIEVAADRVFPEKGQRAP